VVFCLIGVAGRWQSLHTAGALADKHFASVLNCEWVHSDQFLREISTHEDGRSGTVMYRWDANHGCYRIELCLVP
jgi:streptomycin 6-kinase